VNGEPERSSEIYKTNAAINASVTDKKELAAAIIYQAKETLLIQSVNGRDRRRLHVCIAPLPIRFGPPME
jgi:hypothetical protein